MKEFFLSIRRTSLTKNNLFSIIFFGTSEFAVPSLEALLKDSRFKILAVVTQPDRPVGRHAVVTPPPIKRVAEQHGIPVLQPEKIKDLTVGAYGDTPSDRPTESIGSTQAHYHAPLRDADVFVVVSYGKILPQWLLDIPKHGVVNVHGSLLPRWRGASPIQAAIAAGDEKTGVTIMKIDALMDHGPILAMEEEPILENETGGFLHDRLALLGAKTLPNVLADYLNGKIEPREQDHAHAMPCKILTRDDGKIDWNKTAEEIERLVRAYNPWPGTWMEIDGKRLKILAVRIRPNDSSSAPGTRFIWNKRPSISCGHGTDIELVTVQPEGKKAMSGEEFVRGQKWQQSTLQQ